MVFDGPQEKVEFLRRIVNAIKPGSHLSNIGRSKRGNGGTNVLRGLVWHARPTTAASLYAFCH
jgi:hypothetical protein